MTRHFAGETGDTGCICSTPNNRSEPGRSRYVQKLIQISQAIEPETVHHVRGLTGRHTEPDSDETIKTLSDPAGDDVPDHAHDLTDAGLFGPDRLLQLSEGDPRS